MNRNQRFQVRLTERQNNLLQEIKKFWNKYDAIPSPADFHSMVDTDESYIYIQRFFRKLKDFNVINQSGYKDRLRWGRHPYEVVLVDNYNRRIKEPPVRIKVSEFASGAKA